MPETGIVVVLTALNLEYRAVHKLLGDVTKHRHDTGTRFEVGTVTGTGCRIALGLTGPGNNKSATIAEQAIREFQPSAIMMVGVAGALRTKVALGDVVVASQVYAYHGATSTDAGRHARPRVWETDHGIVQLASALDRASDWRARLSPDSGKPSIHVGPIASGEVLQNSRSSADAVWLHDVYNDAAAIEMEAAGVAQAAHLSRVGMVVVRGISDRADGTKSAGEDANWQPRAAANAAAFAVRLAAEIGEETGIGAGERNASSRTEAAAPVPATSSVLNMASGTVGIQAGSVADSTVWMNTAPTSAPMTGESAELIAAVASLRGRVDRDRAGGEVDEDVYEMVRDELATAERALREPGGRRRSLLALKKLTGLVSGTTETATGLAAVIKLVGEGA